ncbi:hypothetical protein [Elizabethkingia ursingii]|uniref:hypothetical protein n=1 Tax=Elizabethkingia ursingii TaxID=1756150 RepID=UPI002011D14C|nr:hypothetical protein [Elizabethkingia ursingii]MCL1671514.1 hypothetical protein [Elizabethkingia ursingii]
MKKYLLKIYFTVSLLLVADIAAYYFYKISLRGYYADIILFWLWFLGSITVIIVFWKNILAKLFLGAIVLALILSMAPMGLFFYAFILSSTPFGLRMEKDLNKNYRAQIVSYSVMTPPWLQIIEKKGLIEQQIIQCTDSELQDKNLDVSIRNSKDLILEKETDNTITLTLFYGGPNTSLTFNKATGKLIRFDK